MSDNRTEPTITGFTDFDLGPLIQRGIAAAGFESPRPIQDQAIPAALAGRDILGLAQTGTGKTAAFALPILERLMLTRKPGPRVLILAPTRELAAQINAEIRTLAQFTNVKTATIFGGVSAHSQKLALKEKPEILVACPGRLLDLWRQGVIRLNHIEMLVLDEADHMFDMGFLPDIRRVLDALPEKRQNLLFSATMPKEIRRLANHILNRPEVVDVAHNQPLSTIEHALYPVAQLQKYALLERVLEDDEFVSAIVFTRTKHRAKRLAQQLSRAGHSVVALQGNMSQGQRERAMNGFRKKQFDILVATDIAARGIDVEQVSHVVNFDMPNTADQYTHRIGRTGRAEREGKAYTFVTEDDTSLVQEVEIRVGEPIPLRTVDGIEPARFSTRPEGNGRRPNNGSGRPPRQRQAQAANGGGRRRRPSRPRRTA